MGPALRAPCNRCPGYQSSASASSSVAAHSSTSIEITLQLQLQADNSMQLNKPSRVADQQKFDPLSQAFPRIEMMGQRARPQITE